jgi:energy-coupling factor transporter transmembrane protein EcfT
VGVEIFEGNGMSNIISAVSAVTNIYSLIAFILLLAVFTLLKLRIIEQRLFQWLVILFIVSLLAISFWIIYKTQTKQGGQQQASPPISQQPTQTAISTGNASLLANQIILNQTGGQTSIVVGNNKAGDSSVPTQIKQLLPKQPFHEKETNPVETAKKPVISMQDSGSVQRERKESFAATVKAEVQVTANDAGVVTITGGKGIVNLVQYCPDERARGCDDNIIIKREGNSFALNKEGLANHQTVFNFRDSSEKLLRILHEEVTCGANVTCETSK